MWPKHAVSGECCTQRCYCELLVVTNVVYNNFQDMLVPWKLYSALGNTRNFLRASPHSGVLRLGFICFGQQNILIFCTQYLCTWKYHRVLIFTKMKTHLCGCMWLHSWPHLPVMWCSLAAHSGCWYRIAENFQMVQIFVYFKCSLRVRK